MIIGITGSIASGKSTLSRYLIKQGYTIIDADKLAYDALTIDERCVQKTLAAFDCQDAEGMIDRQKLGRIIFNNKQKQKELENIVHPYVIERLEKAVKDNTLPLLFLDIPLLYESHLEYLCDRIIVVYVDLNTQLQRLKKRNQLNDEDALARIHAQMSMAEKKQRADYLLDNSQAEEDLYKQVDTLLKKLRKEVSEWKNY